MIYGKEINIEKSNETQFYKTYIWLANKINVLKNKVSFDYSKQISFS